MSAPTTNTTDMGSHQAMRLCATAITNQYGMEPIDDRDLKQHFYNVKKAEKYKTVYFIQPAFTSNISVLCPLARKRNKAGQRCHKKPCGSYSVTVATGKVTQVCFNTKCKRRDGGKYVLQEETPDATSSDDSDFVSSEEEEDEEEETGGSASKKRKHN